MENKQPSRFGNFLKKAMLYGGGIMALAGTFLQLADLPLKSIFSVFGFSFLALYAFIVIPKTPYKPLNDSEIDEKLHPLWTFSVILLGYGLSVLLIGLLYLLRNWPSPYIMIIVGVGGIVISFFMWLYYRKKRKQYEI